MRLRTWYSGISAGTELTAYRGSNPYLTRTWDAERRLFVDGEPTFAYPVQGWGYSEVGEVVEVADDVEAPGRRATWCTASGATAATRWSRPPRSATGSGPPTTPISGTFARVGSIALNAVLAAEARLGDRVAVFGQGVIGLLATRLAVLSGAEVVAVDTVPERLAAARAMGAAEVVTATVDGGAGAAIRAWSGGGVDAAIELSGNDRALHEAVRSVVVDGTVVASGFYQGGAEHLRLGEEFHHNRVRIVASQIGGTPVALGPRWDQPRLVRTFMDQVRRGRVDARSLVTDVVDAADVAAVFERLDRGDPAILQAVLRFPAAPEAAVIVDTAPRFPADRAGVAILGCGTIAQSAHLPAYEQYGVGVTGVWSRQRGDHRPRAGPLPLRRPGLRHRRGPAGRPGGALRRPRHRSGGPAGLDRGGGGGRQARAGPEAAHPVGRRPGPAARGAGPRRGGGRPRRGEPQRALGPAVARGDPARARRERSGRSSGSRTCTTSRCPR